MTPEQFKERGCYTCGSFNFEQPFIPVDTDSTAPINNPKSVLYDPNAPIMGIPVREPYLRCVECESEYPFDLINQLDDESWQYGYDRRHRAGGKIKTTYYESEAQFDPEMMRKGFLLQEEEDVERPG